MIGHVAPIQLAIRLLVPQGSLMLQLEDVRRVVGPFDPRSMTYPWGAQRSRVDALHHDVAALVAAGSPRLAISCSMRSAISRTWGRRVRAHPQPRRHRATVRT